jgi:ribosomal protein S18 acetylase RimI-like enzyme
MFSPATADLGLVLGCEQRIINAWPAVTTLLIGGYAVRFANGFSGRANSASAITPGAELDAAAFALIEELYRAENLPPCIRLTPLVAEATQAAALARGYRVKDASFGMISDISGGMVAIDPQVTIESRPSAAWIAGVAARQTGVKTHVGNLTAILGQLRLPGAFASVVIDGEPVAYGMSVAELGMAEIGLIVVDASQRGKGLGQRLVGSLMAWAAEQGCGSAYLQVEENNAVAMRLYDRLGFRKLYRYETRILD